MLNKTINQINSDVDFMKFIHINFMKEVKDETFPLKHEMRKKSKDNLKTIEEKNPTEAKRIIERELIRDNIYLKYKFDIFEKPIVVYYEDEKNKKLKPFKKYDEANNFCMTLLNKGVYSILILIMNHDIECKIYKD